MGIDIITLAKECPDMVVSVKVTDLLEAFRKVIEENQEIQLPKAMIPAVQLSAESFSREETMELLGVSAPTLWRWMKNGYLVPYKLGTKVRYRKNDVLKLKEGDINEQ